MGRPVAFFQMLSFVLPTQRRYCGSSRFQRLQRQASAFAKAHLFPVPCTSRKPKRKTSTLCTSGQRKPIAPRGLSSKPVQSLAFFPPCYTQVGGPHPLPGHSGGLLTGPDSPLPPTFCSLHNCSVYLGCSSAQNSAVAPHFTWGQGPGPCPWLVVTFVVLPSAPSLISVPLPLPPSTLVVASMLSSKHTVHSHLGASLLQHSFSDVCGSLLHLFRG